MNPKTFGYSYDAGKIVPIQCVKNDKLDDIDIKDACFLLTILYEGTAYFRVGDTQFEAIAPCFVCFDETQPLKLVKKRGLKCDSIYFDPTFLNINMTFSRIHSGDYEQLASIHDMFLLKPFTDKRRYAYPVFNEYIEKIKSLFAGVERELTDQRDWYWSCRSRSYFIEMMLLLERTCGFVEQNTSIDAVNVIINPHLKKAVIYIESNYRDNIVLKDIVNAAALNHSTLTMLFKNELNKTPIEYLWHHRITVAKKLLEFTDLPIKDIALRCGFKTVQHFSRKFEETTESSPGAFRAAAVSGRKESFKNIEFTEER